MQSTGQYGVTDSPQFLVARAPHAPGAHIFSISHDNISLSPPSSHPSSHSHSHSHQGGHHAHAHHLPHHLAAQHQHHYAAHLAHQTHATLQQQIHQTQSQPHATHGQHAQHLQHAQQHSQHAQPPSLAQLQQQQQPQQQQPASLPPAASHQDVPQHQLHQVQAQHQAQQQQQQQQQQHQEEQQQAKNQQHAQEQMVQQLGLGEPDSPEVPSPIPSRPSPTNYSKLLLSAQQDDEGLEEEGGRSSGGNRWPRAETLALIQIRSEMDANFRDSGVKGPLWDEVSRKLAEQGYNRSGKKCKEKFENIHKYYKKSKDGRAGRQDGKSYRFFAQLDALFGGQQMTTQVETDTAAAVLLIGAGPPLGVSPTEDLNVAAQRPSEVSTAVTLSKSSDDDYDGPGSGVCENQDKQTKKKRKLEGKMSETPKVEYMEAMMKSLVDKQEAMQRKFFEAMEKIEMDRQAKEEAWRRQEAARWTREHELRVQELAITAQRDAALISFLQKFNGGQAVQLPKFSTPLRDPAVLSSRDSEDS